MSVSDSSPASSRCWFLRKFAVAVTILALLPGAFGSDSTKLPKKYSEWLKKDVGYIITNEEKAAFKGLNTDEARDKFIEHFWEIRNPNLERRRIPIVRNTTSGCNMPATTSANSATAGTRTWAASTSRWVLRSRRRDMWRRAVCGEWRSGLFQQPPGFAAIFLRCVLGERFRRLPAL